MSESSGAVPTRMLLEAVAASPYLVKAALAEARTGGPDGDGSPKVHALSLFNKLLPTPNL